MVVLDLRKLEAFTDYFVICTGDVDQQVRAIVNHIAEQAELQTGQRMLHREGTEALNWVLLDYVDVVVHVFKPSFRAFYRLEDMWGDATEMIVRDESLTQVPKPRTKRVRPQLEAEPAKRSPRKAAARVADGPTVRPAKRKPVSKTSAPRSRTAKKPVRKSRA